MGSSLRDCALLLVALILCTSMSALARTTIVPDDFPTIQAAVDFLFESQVADTLLVRGGIYPEVVVTRRGMRVEAIPSLDGSNSVPRIQGLRASGGRSEHRFIGLHFTGPVQHGGYEGITNVHFIGCRFDSGMTPGAVPGTLTTIRLTRCALYQSVLIEGDEGVMDSCTVYGPVVMTTPYRAYVADNIFENAGTAFSTRTRNAVVARNRVRGGEHAFVLRPDDNLDAHVVDNDIEGCRGYAVLVNADEGLVRLERNRIAQCGGFGASVTGEIEARGNRVTDCRGVGLALLQWSEAGIVEANVVARCEFGIVVESSPWLGPASFTVRENTVYGCTGPGIGISGAPGSTISRNIVNACPGLYAANSDPLDVSCNDWFQVPGAPASTSDLSIDPQFCDLAVDDVRLRSDSPLLDAPGCGRIGALGLGCEAPVVSIGFQVWPRVLQPASRSRWVTALVEPPSPFSVAEIDLASVRLNDVPVAAGIEATVGDRDRDGISEMELRFDRAAIEQTLAAGDAVTVTVTGRIGRRNFTGTDVIRVLRYYGGPRSSVPRPPRERVLSIHAPAPLTIGAGVRVAFTLADESPARMEMLDVAGRVVLTREVGGREPGEHSFDLGHEGLAQGIYFLRLRQGTSEARTRMVVVR